MSPSPHQQVAAAVKDGTLVKPSVCESCGEKAQLHGHHDDYARALDVRWLCSHCHRCWHIDNGPAANRDLMGRVLTVALPVEIHDRMQEIARAECRSLSGEIRRLIDRRIAEYDATKKEAA